MREAKKCVILEIITPKGITERVECDSVRLCLADDKNGRGGGSYGVRAGHTYSILLLAEGTTEAQKDGERVLTLKTGEGFATVDKDTVTVAVEYARPVPGIN